MINYQKATGGFTHLNRDLHGESTPLQQVDKRTTDDSAIFMGSNRPDQDSIDSFRRKSQLSHPQLKNETEFEQLERIINKEVEAAVSPIETGQKSIAAV